MSYPHELADIPLTIEKSQPSRLRGSHKSSQLIRLIDECHSVFRGQARCHREPDRATRLDRSLSKNVDEIFWLWVPFVINVSPIILRNSNEDYYIMGTLHIKNVKNNLVHNYEHIYKNTAVNERHQLTFLLEEIINLWIQSHLITDKTESATENVKWLQEGKNRSFKMIAPVKMRGEGPTALEMVQEGRT